MFARPARLSNAELTGKVGVGYGNRTIFFPFLIPLGHRDSTLPAPTPVTRRLWDTTYLQGWGEPDMEHIIKSSSPITATTELCPLLLHN